MTSKKNSGNPIVRHAADMEERNAVYAGLAQFNSDQTQGKMGRQGIDIFLILENEDGEVVGGISCKILLRSLNIHVLWVDENLRGKGHGKELVSEAERIAMENGCMSAQTSSYSFQALGFYQRLGYEVFGVFDAYPDGVKKHFLMKQF